MNRLKMTGNRYTPNICLVRWDIFLSFPNIKKLRQNAVIVLHAYDKGTVETVGRNGIKMSSGVVDKKITSAKFKEKSIFILKSGVFLTYRHF